MKGRMLSAAAWVALAFGACPPQVALAQAYPSRAIEMIVPFPAGANSDLAARALAEGISKTLGQATVVTNKDGAAGTIGAAAAAAAQPDGYTIVFSAMGPVTAQPHLRDDLRYSAQSFDYICQATDVFVIASVSNESPHKSLKDLIAYARRNPDKLTYGHPGPGTVPHLLMLQLASDQNLKLTPVPFRGDALALNNLLGNHIDILMSGDAAVIGKIRPLAVFAGDRLASLPDVPSTRELGLNTGFGTPNGLFAPKGLSGEVLTKLRAACATAMKSDAFIEAMKKSGQNVSYLDGPAFADRIAQDSNTIAALIAKVGRPKN
ncbi:Bug family tripartite tricarboxylate transporter substrate binding protein [Pseudorhodoplanes sinuspersici]|nr:tripartite tricarboxylate transporter substrate binding protein [Pseudorhodoplanes sinuspersici]